jgi:hypothetical protein
MTPREQIALWLLMVCGGAITGLYLLDWAWEKYDEYQARERTWKLIEMRCSRERHPSYRVSVFDQDAQSR